MKQSLRIEELFMFGLSLYWYQDTGYAWWLFAALFLLPDLGMLGYLINPKVGAITYNLLHHKGIALALFIFGSVAIAQDIRVAGIILFSHASFDRILGYGLKFDDSFNHTHLGWIGKAKVDD